jgi:hypothetical protein
MSLARAPKMFNRKTLQQKTIDFVQRPRFTQNHVMMISIMLFGMAGAIIMYSLLPFLASCP